MDFELVSLVLAVLSWNQRSKGVTPPRWWLVTVVTLSVNRGPESSSTVLYCGIPIRARSVVVVRLLCWEYTLIKLRLLVLVISTNGYNSYFNIGATCFIWFVRNAATARSVTCLFSRRNMYIYLNDIFRRQDASHVWNNSARKSLYVHEANELNSCW